MLALGIFSLFEQRVKKGQSPFCRQREAIGILKNELSISLQAILAMGRSCLSM